MDRRKCKQTKLEAIGGMMLPWDLLQPGDQAKSLKA
jgi:hypothetical protein